MAGRLSLGEVAGCPKENDDSILWNGGLLDRGSGASRLYAHDPSLTDGGWDRSTSAKPDRSARLPIPNWARAGASKWGDKAWLRGDSDQLIDQDDFGRFCPSRCTWGR